MLTIKLLIGYLSNTSNIQKLFFAFSFALHLSFKIFKNLFKNDTKQL